MTNFHPQVISTLSHNFCQPGSKQILLYLNCCSWRITPSEESAIYPILHASAHGHPRPGVSLMDMGRNYAVPPIQRLFCGSSLHTYAIVRIQIRNLLLKNHMLLCHPGKPQSKFQQCFIINRISSLAWANRQFYHFKRNKSVIIVLYVCIIHFIMSWYI